MLSSCKAFVGDSGQTNLPWRRKSPSTWTCRRRNARKSSCSWTSASVSTGPAAGTPTWLNQMIEHRAASTTSHKLIRHQRKPTRHLCQKPDRISRAVGRNGEVARHKLVEHRREYKHPAFAVNRDGSQRGVGAGQFGAERHGKFLAGLE